MFGFQIPVGQDFLHPSRLAPRLTQPTPQSITLLSPRGQSGDDVLFTSCPHVLLKFNKELNYTKVLFVIPTDAHNYKIIGMLKTIQILTIVFNIPMIL